MNVLTIFIAVACVAPGLAQFRRFRQGRPCYTPENDIGRCFVLSSCPSIANVFRTYPRNVAITYVRTAQRNCGNNVINQDPVVCCGENQNIFVQPTTPSINPFFPTNPPTPQPTIIPDPVTSPTTTTTVTTTTPAPILTPQTTEPTITDRSDGCRGPDLRYGTCKALAQCPTFVTRLRQMPSDQDFANFLRTSNEFCGGQFSVICCPDENQQKFEQKAIFPTNTNAIPTKLLTLADGCGYSDNVFRKIVGGTASKVGAWPWIALIGYDDGVSTSPFKCGGTLITSRHVLTAAHCIRSDLKFVRLGEHDLSTTTEANHVDIPVVKVLRHPMYNRADGHNDIALLYLGQNVVFSSKITPICLPLTQAERSMSYVSLNPFVAGWGRTMEGGTSATILQELQIPVYDNSKCVELYKRQNKLLSEQQFDNAVICAGDLGGGKDTCQGDSGGPLMLPEQRGTGVRFKLIGIVSYGIGCARPEVPGVYSRVGTFIDWIQEGVANTPAVLANV